MSKQEQCSDTAKTCWSCEGVGQRYKSCSGRAYREPCPTCAGTGEVHIVVGPGYLRTATRWLLNSFAPAA